MIISKKIRKTIKGARAAGGTVNYNSPESNGDNKSATEDKESYGGTQRTYNQDGSVNPGGADLATARFQQMGAAAGSTAAYQANVAPQINDQGLAGGARVAQQTGLDLDLQAAQGNAPSAATIAGQQAIQQSLQAQMAGAAGARGGPAAQAAAERQAATGAGSFQQNALQTLASNRAAEMAQARGQYDTSAGAIRSGDQSQQNIDLGVTGQDINNQNTQRALNQQGQLSYEQLGQNVQTAQMQAGATEAGIDAGNFNQGRSLANNDSQFTFNKIASLGGTVGSGVAGGAAGAVANSGGGGGGSGSNPGSAATGGEVDDAKPYLVGEKGPELIIPDKPGYVMTAHQTAALLGGGGPTKEQAAHIRYKALDDESPHARALGGLIGGSHGAPNPATGSMAVHDWKPGSNITANVGAMPTHDSREGTPAYDAGDSFTPGLNQPNFMAQGGYVQAGGYDSGTKTLTMSDERSKERAHARGYMAGHQDAKDEAQSTRGTGDAVSAGDAATGSGDAEAEVADRRKAGGYAAVDTTPGTTPEQNAHANLMGAMADSTAGASDPQADADAKAAADAKPAAGSGGGGFNWRGMVQGLAGGVGARNAPQSYSYSPQPPPMQPPPNYAYSDEETKEKTARDAYRLGRAHGWEQESTGKAVPYAYGGPKREGESDLVDQDPAMAGGRNPYEYARPRSPTQQEQAQKAQRVQRQTDAHVREMKNAEARNFKGDEEDRPISPDAIQLRDMNRRYAVGSARPLDSPMLGKYTPPPADSVAKANQNAPWSSPVEDRSYGPQAPAMVSSSDDEPRAKGGPIKAKGKLSGMVEDAARKMKSSPYSYKGGFTPPEQEEGETNFGPMAQELEKNPITKTTVKKDGAGMRMVDMHKLTKVHSGAIAHLQRQVDDLKAVHRGR